VNIFALDWDPFLAAQFQCDKHVVKMVLESAQILCSAFPDAPYKRTHPRHPCVRWALSTRSNYDWLVKHAYGLSDEYISALLPGGQGAFRSMG